MYTHIYIYTYIYIYIYIYIYKHILILKTFTYSILWKIYKKQNWQQMKILMLLTIMLSKMTENQKSK